MPFIKLKLSGNFTKKQREAVTKEFSDTLLRTAGNPKDDIHIVVDEVSGKNWAKVYFGSDQHMRGKSVRSLSLGIFRSYE